MKSLIESKKNYYLICLLLFKKDFIFSDILVLWNQLEEEILQQPLD